MADRGLTALLMAVIIALAIWSSIGWSKVNDRPTERPRVAIAEVQCSYDCTTPQTEMVDEQCGLPDVTAVRLTVLRSNGYRVTREIDCLEADR